jgi:CDP-diacylglycerol--serine O-phosphatidyltransferase
MDTDRPHSDLPPDARPESRQAERRARDRRDAAIERAGAAEWRSRHHRRLRLRRRGRRAYIRSVYFLPSLATLGNLICGFGAIYVATLRPWPDAEAGAGADPWAAFFSVHRFVVACYLIFAAMLFDAIDGQLARFTRHTTDFGGQLDSLADCVSFGVAPAMIMLHAFKDGAADGLPLALSRLVWAIGALYAACAAMRLARFNVSNKHDAQHHFSFLGLPSPGAAAAVVGFVLLQQELYTLAHPKAPVDSLPTVYWLWVIATCLLPLVVLSTGLLMVSNIRYAHFTNRYLKGRRSFGRMITAVVVLLLLVVAHKYVIAAGTLFYAYAGVTAWLWYRMRRKAPAVPTR